jgi:predicted dehydrogenase
MVGYNLRFHPSLQLLKAATDRGSIGRILSVRAEVGQYLPEWRPGSDYRNSVSARRELGGGVFLELSHELDYVRWIAGEITSVMAQADHISDLELNVEDTAEIILRFASGAMGSVHLDMIQQPATRSCKLIGTEGVLTWDGISGSVRLYSAKTGTWSDLHTGQKNEWNQMYLDEMEHFISCIRKRKDPLVTGLDGKRVLEIALAALQSTREQRCIQV